MAPVCLCTDRDRRRESAIEAKKKQKQKKKRWKGSRNRVGTDEGKRVQLVSGRGQRSKRGMGIDPSIDHYIYITRIVEKTELFL
jgi:hypothetical protein